MDQRIAQAIARRGALHDQPNLSAYRLIHGAADGLPGLFVDRYGPGCTLIRHLGVASDRDSPEELARSILRASESLGVRAVYDKPFVADRSRQGGREDPILRRPKPLAGEALPKSILIQEPSGRFEVRLYDGFSTGLFLDQRDNRRALAEVCRRRPGARVANLFAYTGGFSVACACAGATTSTVDVSPRILDWARRNLEHNGLDSNEHYFARMDAREFLRMAARKERHFDVIILDPPTFGAADKSRRIPAWSSVRDYPELLRLAQGALAPEGVIFASTNTSALCEEHTFDHLTDQSLGTKLERGSLPARPIDFPVGDAFPASRLITQTRS